MTDETPITLERVKTHLRWRASGDGLIDADDYLEWAVAEIERLQKIVAASNALHSSAMVQLSGLTRESAKYRKALEHYRDRKHWGSIEKYVDAKHCIYEPKDRNGWDEAEEALRDE